MKKYNINQYLIFFSILFLSCVSCTYLQAQEDTRRFKGGLVFGINLSQIDGDFLAGYNQPGLNVGGTVSTAINDRFAVSLEMIYSQKGARRSVNDGFRSSFDKIRFNFVEAPVLVHFYDWKFRVSAGFSYARLIDYTIIDINGEDISDNQVLKDNNFSLIIGATYFINDHWGFGVRWSRETDVQADDGATDFRGRSLAIRGTYIF